MGTHEKPIMDVDRFLSMIRFDSREKVQDLVEKGGKLDSIFVKIGSSPLGVSIGFWVEGLSQIS